MELSIPVLSWIGAGAVAGLGLAVRFVQAYTAHIGTRLGHAKAQVDSLQSISDLDTSNLTAEEELGLGAVLRFAYQHDFSTRLYAVLRDATEPAVAMRLYRDVSPFIEMTDEGDRLRYKQRKILYSDKTSSITVWRVRIVFAFWYFVLTLLGGTAALASAAGAMNGLWGWVAFLIPIATSLVIVGFRVLSTGQRFEDNIGAFSEAAGNLMKESTADGAISS
jgi:hypothetical protein